MASNCWALGEGKKVFLWDLLRDSLVTCPRLLDWKSNPCNLLDPCLVVNNEEGSQPCFPPPIDQGGGLARDACGFVWFKPLQPIGQPGDWPSLYQWIILRLQLAVDECYSWDEWPESPATRPTQKTRFFSFFLGFTSHCSTVTGRGLEKRIICCVSKSNKPLQSQKSSDRLTKPTVVWLSCTVVLSYAVA